CNSGGKRVFKRRSSLISALAEEVTYDVIDPAPGFKQKINFLLASIVKLYRAYHPQIKASRTYQI
ncbi:MAG: hypothetical protein WBB28_13095, partial [Crinalium sp.]